MTQRLARISEFLKGGQYEMAVNLYTESKIQITSQSLLIDLARAYFSMGSYQQCIAILQQLGPNITLKSQYEAGTLKFKASYLLRLPTNNILNQVLHFIQKHDDDKSTRLKCLRQMQSVVRTRTRHPTESQWDKFSKLMKVQDDTSLAMQGMPMFIISQMWYEKWQSYAKGLSREQPGPITQFPILDHPYNLFFDPSSVHATKCIFATAAYVIVPKKCWLMLHGIYGGIEIPRYNISTVSHPYEVFTEVHLKGITINKDKLRYRVQVSRKETWGGVRGKLGVVWGQGNIYEDGTKNKNCMMDADILEDVDVVNVEYVYVKERVKAKISEMCGNCKGIVKLKYCECMTIKYCGMECLKEDRKKHRKMCELHVGRNRQFDTSLDEFSLEERSYGGKEGVVGLKNLGNTCYLNSGLQCLSNTKEITDFFMTNEFKTHINTTNNLGTKGHLACAYAQLIRQMWTGSDSVLVPSKLKKRISNFASQFVGYGQQDSQQFISYLVDGLGQDLNLVREKKNFQLETNGKSDEVASKESEKCHAGRTRSHIRNLMAGQYKSTVTCEGCLKVSICFDPFLMLSIPIPSPASLQVFVVPCNNTIAAFKVKVQYSNKSKWANVKSILVEKFIQGECGTLQAKKLLIVSLDSVQFQIVKEWSDDELVSEHNKNNVLFVYQVPKEQGQNKLFLVHYYFQKKCVCYPRIIQVGLSIARQKIKECVIESLTRSKTTLSDPVRMSPQNLIESITQSQKIELGMLVINVKCNKQFSLLRFVHSSLLERIQEKEGTMTLNDCLEAFKQEQRLEKQNEWYCNKCKRIGPAKKQMQIYKSNKILVLTFKRFTRFRKIKTPIIFPIQGFDISPFLLSHKSKTPVLYDLYGVVNHFGTLLGGHYTASCKNFRTNKWYEFNDSHVEEIRARDAVTANAYVLFYRRSD